MSCVEWDGNEPEADLYKTELLFQQLATNGLLIAIGGANLSIEATSIHQHETTSTFGVDVLAGMRYIGGISH